MDRCLKIYINRVDSITIATGRLFSRLTDSRDMKEIGNDHEMSRKDSASKGRLERKVTPISFSAELLAFVLLV